MDAPLALFRQLKPQSSGHEACGGCHRAHGPWQRIQEQLPAAFNPEYISSFKS